MGKRKSVVKIDGFYREDRTPQQNVEDALKRYKKQYSKENIAEEYRSRERFEKPSAKVHRAKRYAEHVRKFQTEQK